MELKKLLEEINKNLEILKKSRPLSKGELIELKKSLNIMFAYNSNAIEGNSFTLGETKLLFEDGITVGGKTLREQNEVLNHKELIAILDDFLKNGDEINEDLILKIHKEILKNIDNENAGIYRRIQNYISGDIKIPPRQEKVPGLMKELIDKYNEEKDIKNPVLLASEFHYEFAHIHPFVDGNGRTIRLIINMILMQKGFPMIIIPFIRRKDYISSLSSYKTKDDFILFMADIINENIKDYLRMINPNLK